jgi:hypothetical protein
MGLRPDFLVNSPTGHLIVIEAKTSFGLSAAIRQMDVFVKILGAVSGVIAVPDSVHPADQPSDLIKVVRISELPTALKALTETSEWTGPEEGGQ